MRHFGANPFTSRRHHQSKVSLNEWISTKSIFYIFLFPSRPAGVECVFVQTIGAHHLSLSQRPIRFECKHTVDGLKYEHHQCVARAIIEYILSRCYEWTNVESLRLWIDLIFLKFTHSSRLSIIVSPSRQNKLFVGNLWQLYRIALKHFWWDRNLRDSPRSQRRFMTLFFFQQNFMPDSCNYFDFFFRCGSVKLFKVCGICSLEWSERERIYENAKLPDSGRCLTI